MSYNGSGTFLINTAGQPVVSGTVISSTAFNALTADLATGLSTAITKDGQTTITANIPMANYKFTGLGVGSAAGDSANLSQVQSTAVKLLASVSGADTITAVGSPNVAAYVAGQMFYFVAAGANTGAVTINIDSLGAKNITRDGTTALAAGDIQSGEVCVIVYDGTQFQLVNGASQSAAIVTNSLTVTGPIKLDGNYPVGLNNVAMGETALDSVQTGGDNNVALGYQALTALTTADNNVGIGRDAGISITTGANNILIGRGAGDALTTTAGSTAVGHAALGASTVTGTAFGYQALVANTSGANNVAIGYNAAVTNTTGGNNVAVGQDALYSNTTASNNTAVGYQAAYSNTTGTENTAFGQQALYTNTTGREIHAAGRKTLFANTTGSYNTGSGATALAANTTGSNNTAHGYRALYSNTTASNNTAVGYQSLYANTTGADNVAVGRAALDANTTGNRNTALGDNALSAVTTGDNNVGVGRSAGLALTTGVNNTFVGAYNGSTGGSGELITTGSKNTILGSYNGNQGGLDIRTSSNNIVLSDGDGNPRGFYASVGANYAWVFSQQTTPTTVNASEMMQIDMGGTGFGVIFLGAAGETACRFYNRSSTSVIGSISLTASATSYNTSSDQRLKENITDAEDAGEKVDAIQVRQFDWKVDGAHQDYGMVAQELMTVAPEAVSGDPESDNMMGVDYSKLVPMLVKEVQSLRKRVAELEAK